MNIYSRLVVLIVFFALIVGCKAKSPSTSGSDDSSSSDSTGSSTTSYAGKWLKSDGSVGLDWRSDSFIYGCTKISNITYAAHGSYNSSNKRLTWWDGSYNSLTSSGSNIVFDSSATYSPAVLYANCNPWWTSNTSENTSYTYLARSIGYWTFTYTLISTWTDNILMNAIASRTYSDGSYYIYGTNSNGDIVTGSYNSSNGVYDILDASGSNISEYYTYYLNSSYSGITAGCYYQINKSTNAMTNCFSISSGTKLYGTPRSYRIISENDKDKIELQKQKEMTKLINQGSDKLTEQDINAYQRYQNLLRTYESIDKESLKRFLKSFRSN